MSSWPSAKTSRVILLALVVLPFAGTPPIRQACAKGAPGLCRLHGKVKFVTASGGRGWRALVSRP